MRSDPSPVTRLTLPEMAWKSPAGDQWTDPWKFTVRATAEAKGVILEDGKSNPEDGSDSGSD